MPRKNNRPPEVIRTRNSWRAMRSRCFNPNDEHFFCYGAVGITVCPEWAVFSNFLADMGMRPIGKTIDRIDGKKGYSPDNCRWATKAEQIANRTLTRAIVIEFNGKRQGLPAWTKELNVGTNTISRRLQAGWSVEKALTVPGYKARGNVRKSRKSEVTA